MRSILIHLTETCLYVPPVAPKEQVFPMPCQNPERSRIVRFPFYMTTPELLAIRWEENDQYLLCIKQEGEGFRREKLTGQSSAASFPTGPVIAEPFISPLGLTICWGKLLAVFLFVPSKYPFPIHAACHQPQTCLSPSQTTLFTTATYSCTLRTNRNIHSPHQHYPRSTRRHRLYVSMACSV